MTTTSLTVKRSSPRFESPLLRLGFSGQSYVSVEQNEPLPVGRTGPNNALPVRLLPVRASIARRIPTAAWSCAQIKRRRLRQGPLMFVRHENGENTTPLAEKIAIIQDLALARNNKTALLSGIRKIEITLPFTVSLKSRERGLPSRTRRLIAEKAGESIFQRAIAVGQQTGQNSIFPSEENFRFRSGTGTTIQTLEPSPQNR